MASTTVLSASLGMNDHQQTDLGAMITLATLNDRHPEVMVRLACKGFPSWVGTFIMGDIYYDLPFNPPVQQFFIRKGHSPYTLTLVCQIE